MCSQVGMKVLLIGSDGATNELLAQMEVTNLSESHLNYQNSKQNIEIEMKLVGSPPIPLVGIQDPKHACKKSVNKLISRARLLCFGKF